jgi:hypothetical protein
MYENWELAPNPTRRPISGQAGLLLTLRHVSSKNRGIAFNSQFLLDYGRIDSNLAS